MYRCKLCDLHAVEYVCVCAKFTWKSCCLKQLFRCNSISTVFRAMNSRLPRNLSSVMVVCLSAFLVYCLISYVGTSSQIRVVHVSKSIETTNPRLLENSNVLTSKLNQAKDDDDLDLRRMFLDRKQHVQHMCNDSLVPAYQRRYRNVSKGGFYYSKPSKFAVCKAPKTGTTFWGTVVFALEPGSDVNNTFRLNRNIIHTGQNFVGLGNIKGMRGRNEELLLSVVSRDPWTRIYSAYVDKVIVNMEVNQKFGKHYKKEIKLYDGAPCGYSVSFQEFLNVLVFDAINKTKFDEHWAPVWHLCDVCGINYDIFSKQETLTRDTQYTLDRINVSPDKKQKIKDLLQAKGDKVTIIPLIKSHVEDHRRFKNIKCDFIPYFRNRVWPSLKIQGLLHENSSFPAEEFAVVSNKDVNKVIHIMSSILLQQPVSKEQKKRQKLEAIAHAYSEIQEETIQQIVDLYKLDFLLFNYTQTPPSL